ncbi:MAG: phage tail protein [Beijerinckiaceae bacterium]
MADAAIAYERVVVSGEGITLSQLIWRKFRVWKPGMVERILDRQGELAEFIYLPVGSVVEIPIDPPTPRREMSVISLWD